MVNVFIECAGGSALKNVFDEQTLELKESFTVSREYPFPYGFIPNTKSGDGDCLDCFVITTKPLEIGQMLNVEIIGMMEQFETKNGIRKEDHNILAKIKGERIDITEDVKQKLSDFVAHVWNHRVAKKVEPGKFFGKDEAYDLINKSNQ